jgi:chromosome segregation ATPase
MNDLMREGRFTVTVSVYRVAISIIIEMEVIMNNGDLSHIGKQMQKDDAAAADARKAADNYRMNADQKRQDGDNNSASYYEQEADRLEQQAIDAENEKMQLQNDKDRIEKRIAELESQRIQAQQQHSDQLSRIDSELAQLRGSGLI